MTISTPTLPLTSSPTTKHHTIVTLDSNKYLRKLKISWVKTYAKFFYSCDDFEVDIDSGCSEEELIHAVGVCSIIATLESFESCREVI